MTEQELQMRFPCWVIAEADDVGQSPRVMMMQTNGKSILQLFLEKAEAERFISEAKLTDKLPFTIPTIQHLAGLMEHMQMHGINEVHVISQVEGGFKLANITPVEFLMGLRLHLKP